MNKTRKPKDPKRVEVTLDGSSATYKLYRQLFYPTRLQILNIINERREVAINVLMDELGLKLTAINENLQVLEKLNFIQIENIPNPGHGRTRVAKSLFPPDSEELSIRLILQHLNTVKST